MDGKAPPRRGASPNCIPGAEGVLGLWLVGGSSGCQLGHGVMLALVRGVGQGLLALHRE